MEVSTILDIVFAFNGRTIDLANNSWIIVFGLCHDLFFFLCISYGLRRAIHACLCTAIRLLLIYRRQHILDTANTRTNCEATVRWFCWQVMNMSLIILNECSQCSNESSGLSLSIFYRFQRHKAMFIFFVLLTAGAFMSIKYIDPIPQKTNVAFHCNDGVSVLKHCPSAFDECAAKQLIKYTDSIYSNQTDTMTFQVSKFCIPVFVCVGLLLARYREWNDWWLPIEQKC